ncbi:hypothetical protein U1839_23140 [Sphingomonas sp. RT2P30]|uniref:hypothetical protein n=1 Tax=Parasphingomonas halimpatiens TaxID=3096162 RepID=UPI002FC5CF9F
MTQPTSLRRRALPIMLGLAMAACGWPVAGMAQVAAPVTPAAHDADTIRLSDEQRNAILAGNTVESAAAARGELSGAGRAARGVHGEVGVMIGTNGARGIYGVAAIPLGEHGEAVVSFENSQYGRRR